MTGEEIALVQRSYRQLAPIAATAVTLFYIRLFELDPALAKLFHGPMQHQGFVLTARLQSLVAGLESFDELVPGLAELGRRHTAYGVSEEHYHIFGAALIWMLQQAFGQDFTPALESAWRKAYAQIAAAMQQTEYAARTKGDTPCRSGAVS